jgi:hypothetical protein
LDYKSSDRFGQLTGGSLRAQGPLNEVRLKLYPPEQSEFPKGVLSFGQVSMSKTIPYHPWHVKLDFGIRIADSDETLLCLPLCRVEQRGWEMRALLLRRASGTEIRFERVGLLRISDEDAMTYLSGINRLPSLPDELFHPEHGYIIDII